MKTGHVALLFCVVLLSTAACGESSGSGGADPVSGENSGEAAYERAYKDAWVAACKAAVKDIHRRDPSERVTRVKCARPKGQYEGNTAYDPQLAKAQGREEGMFDGCAYAWDEAYATSGVDVQPRC